MSADYSFYALICGYMPHPEGYRREEREFFFLCVNISFIRFYVLTLKLQNSLLRMLIYPALS